MPRWARCVSEGYTEDPVSADTYKGLPGAEFMTEGLRDLGTNRETVASLLVAIGGPRLRALGIPVPATANLPEHRLYALLARDDSDSAHSRYNALLRRLVSFERALSCAS